jgi:hypothetical protein
MYVDLLGFFVKIGSVASSGQTAGSLSVLPRACRKYQTSVVAIFESS